MLAYWPYILLALLLLALVAAVILYLVLKRARQRAEPKPAGLAPAPVVVEDPSTTGFYSPLAALSLKASFSRAMRTLRANVTRRGYRYRVPWFLMVGESGAGKTAALGGSGMDFLFGRPDEQLHGVKQGLNWFFFDRGVVLDVAGDLVMRGDREVSNQQGWNQLARLLQKHRPERPLDGVVLTIPATELLTAGGLDGRARVEHKAACLYRKLWQAQKLLGMSFPVYVLVTKCDEVTGFQTLCRALPESARGEMFGWSSPYTLETAYRPEWIEEAFRSVYRYLFQLQVEVFAARSDVRDRDGLFLLPSELQALKGPLQLYLDHVFKESSFHDSFFFRGLYFCGDAGEDAQARPAAGALVAAKPAATARADGGAWDPYAQSPERPARDSGSPRPAFVKDLFEQKIFAEDMLARPLARTALSRNRTALAAQLLSLAIPIIGLVGLLFTYGSLERRSNELYDLLVQEERDLEEVRTLRGARASDQLYSEFKYSPSSYAPGAAREGVDGDKAEARAVNSDGARVVNVAYLQARAGEGGARPYARDYATGDVEEPARGAARDATHDNEQHLFAAMASVNAKSYYSVFVPSSWFSDLDSRTRDSLVSGFKYVILEGIAHGLNERTREFIDAEPIEPYERGANEDDSGSRGLAPRGPGAYPPAEDGRGAPPVYDQAFRVGADATLRGYIEGFAELRLNRERYRTISEEGNGSLDQLKGLALYLGHEWPREDFDPNNRLYLDALKRARGAPLSPDSASVQRAFATKVSLMIEAMYERSFERRTGGVRYDYLGDISQTEAMLSRPEYTWLATYVFEPRSPFHDMTLSAGLGELHKALEGLSRESFMGATPGGALSTRQLFVRRQLVWDADALRKALALCADYERFEGERGAYSKNLDDTVRQSALLRLRANVAALVERAQRYEPAAQSPGEPARRASLTAEVGGLEKAQEPLSQLLDATSRLQIDVGLRPALSKQAAYLIGAINQEFQAGQFYSAARADFSWWEGKGSVSLPMFDADSPDALAAYLASERKRISYLARNLAQPVFTFMTAHDIPAQQLRTESRVDWDEITTELDRYDNKQPGGSIATLEEFIRTGMDKASPDDCDALGSGDGASPDFFIRTRNRMRRLLRRQCDLLAQNKNDDDYLHDEEENLRSLRAYREIAAEFEHTLAGRFPFADAPNGAPLTEVEPEDVIKFFAVFDKKKDVAREAIARYLGPSGAEPSAFLDRMDEVRKFFAKYLEKKEGPFVDFQLQFRSNREMETPGARQIIDWTLDVGRRKYGYRDQEMSGRWVVGEPMRLTLRWANNSPVIPSVSPDTATLRTRERVATFEFKSRWALLAMLRRQATTAGDFQYGVDTLPYTLKFVVPTRQDGDLVDRQPVELRGADAQVFMSLSLVEPGTKEPLVVPTFPAWAPKF
jgi:hypothetical protein